MNQMISLSNAIIERGILNDLSKTKANAALIARIEEARKANDVGFRFFGFWVPVTKGEGARISKLHRAAGYSSCPCY